MSTPIPPRRSRSPIKISIPTDSKSGFTPQEIKTALTRLELETRDEYIRSFTDRTRFFQEFHPGAVIEFKEILEGTTDTKFVSVDGVPLYVLKKVSLPEKAFGGEMSHALQESKKTSLVEKLRDILIDTPMSALVHKKPYFLGASREYLAYVFGKDLGVPKTQLLGDAEGVYSIHDFVINNGSADALNILHSNKELDAQSVQNLAILDLVLENQDRNPGNILAIEEESQIKLIPVDHALIFQFDDSKESIKNLELRPPCWAKYSVPLSVPLTDQTRQFIHALSADKIIHEAGQMIVLEESIQRRLRENIEKLKNFLPEISTTKELYEKWMA